MPKRTIGSSVPAKQGKRTRTALEQSETLIRIARRQIYKSWKQIVQGLIDQASKGGYQHAKVLLEICGITRLTVNKTQAKEITSLSDRLLQGLELYVDEQKNGKDRNHDKGNS